MTKKRFVKLAMASGYSRNAANNIAAEFNAEGKTYAEAYQAITAVKTLCAILAPAAIKTVEKFVEVIGKMVNAFSAGWEAFLERYSAAMTEE